MKLKHIDFIVLPCYTMNVTLKLSDSLLKEARHRAVDDNKSLSAWMAALLERELRGGTASEVTVNDIVNGRYEPLKGEDVMDSLSMDLSRSGRKA